MGFEIQKKFEYAEVSDDVSVSLQRHEATIRGIQSKAIYDIGEELQAAHDLLANYRTGIFYAWCENIGIKVKTAQNILAYHDFIRQNLPNKAMLEELPKSLVYEAARKSAFPELKQGVLDGDITTLKEYKALKAELEAEKKARADAESKNAELEGRAMETEQRAQTEVADVKHRIRILKSQHEQERNDLNQQAVQAKAELESLEVELLHKQSEVDALKHEQRMQQEPQIVYQDSEDTIREVNTLKYQLDEIKKQLTDSQTYAKRQTERAEWAEKNAKSQTEMVRRAQAEVQALKNGMSLQAYSREHEAYAQYQSTSEEDYETAQRALRWLGHLGEAPQTEPEVKEWIRCLMLGIEDKPYEMAARRDDVETAMKKLQMFYDALTAGGLKRVK